GNGIASSSRHARCGHPTRRRTCWPGRWWPATWKRVSRPWVIPARIEARLGVWSRPGVDHRGRSALLTGPGRGFLVPVVEPVVPGYSVPVEAGLRFAQSHEGRNRGDVASTWGGT